MALTTVSCLLDNTQSNVYTSLIKVYIPSRRRQQWLASNDCEIYLANMANSTMVFLGAQQPCKVTRSNILIIMTKKGRQVRTLKIFSG